MKHLFIINPAAGGIGKHLDQIRGKIDSFFAAADEPYEIYITQAPMDAVEKIRREADRSQELLRVYACGGDGTLNECVNGAALRSNVQVCPYPVGTGNDFVKTFGQDAAACFTDLEQVTTASFYAADLIRCNDRWCVNICSVGIDARIGTDVHKYSHLPLIGGAAGYVTSLVVNIAKGINQTYTVRCGEYEKTGLFSLICACNGTHYGGGFNPVPEASPFAGEINFLVVGQVSRLSFLRLVGKYAAGKYRQMRRYISALRGDHMTIEAESPIVVNVDGEALYARKIDLTLHPCALQLVVPASLQPWRRLTGIVPTAAAQE